VRHALVTGGGKGIGRAITERLVEDGYTVTIAGRDVAALEATAKTLNTEKTSGAATAERVGIVVGDVGDETSVTEMVACATAARGPISVLVNNAGIAGSAPIARTSLADWEQHLRVNATGPFLCTRAVLPSMLAADWGRIVTVASIASHVGWAYTSAYVASKHAVLGFMRALAAEVRDSGVTANTVCPAYVNTEMADRAFERVRLKTGRSAEESAAAVLRATNQKRLLEPSEVSAAVAYFVSDAAAAINGQSLLIDGGALQH
jgi:NAD(P)-dependent dehydrogenase (short-subunit alcohol dehydrogenase family)